MVHKVYDDGDVVVEFINSITWVLYYFWKHVAFGIARRISRTILPVTWWNVNKVDRRSILSPWRKGAFFSGESFKNLVLRLISWAITTLWRVESTVSVKCKQDMASRNSLIHSFGDNIVSSIRDCSSLCTLLLWITHSGYT